MAAIPLNKELFEEKISKLPPGAPELDFLGKNPAVVDFYAEWCGPCRMMAPLLDEMSEIFGGMVDFYKVNVDEENELSACFNIRSIPTLLVISRAGRVQRFTGAMPRERLKQILDELIAMR